VDPYLPPLGIALVAVVCVAVVRRGRLSTRTALVLAALLPVHLAVVALFVADRYCSLINGPCLERLDVPVDLLWTHVALAGTAIVVALLAWRPLVGACLCCSGAVVIAAVASAARPREELSKETPTVYSGCRSIEPTSATRARTIRYRAGASRRHVADLRALERHNRGVRLQTGRTGMRDAVRATIGRRGIACPRLNALVLFDVEIFLTEG
jgi:hypothetical protein